MHEITFIDSVKYLNVIVEDLLVHMDKLSMLVDFAVLEIRGLFIKTKSISFFLVGHSWP